MNTNKTSPAARRSHVLFTSILGMLMLAAGACGADGGGGVDGIGANVQDRGRSASPVPGKPGDANIVEIALAVNDDLGEFDYLLGAVGCLTDDDGNNPVVDLLTGDDKKTLFAPTDDAFEQLQLALGVEEDDLDPAVTCTLGNDVVLDVLAYHVTDGRRFSNSVFNRNNSKPVEMLNGESITTNPDLTITDIAGQSVGVVPDFVNINASNGVIHVVDTVMLPFIP
jgi:uncharacterized surface protein with fasciclin (FAS1) repeats